MNRKHIIVAVIVLILVGALSYKAGQSHPASSAAASGSRASQQAGAPGAGVYSGFGANGANSGRMRPGGAGDTLVMGDILSADANSITLKLRDGGSRIVFLSASSTKITKIIDADKADLAPGSHVTVTGSANPDGSVTGLSVQLRQGQN